LLQPQVAQPAPPIATQTPVEIELLHRLSSETMKNGQVVDFRIVTPVVIDDVTVIDAGTAVPGEVRAVTTSGAWHKDGAMELMLKPLRLGAGTLVQLEFAQPKLLSTHVSKTATTIGIIAMAPVLLYYFPAVPIAAISASRHGKPYEIRAGERYRVYVASCVHEVAAPAESTRPIATAPPAPTSRE
jgi:hypothetical protein